MKKLLLLILIYNLAFSQIPDYLLNQNLSSDHLEKYHLHNDLEQCQSKLKSKYEMMKLQSEFIPINRRPYDIIEMELYLDFSDVLRFDNEQWQGISKIKFDIIDENADFIELDAVGLIFNEIELNENDISSSVSITDSLLRIPTSLLENTIDNELIINYEKDSTHKDDGFFFVKTINLPDNSEEIYHKAIFTQNQPDYGRTWMPCNDNPYEKQMVKIAIELPETDILGNPYTSASNGQLVDSTRIVFGDPGLVEYVNKVYYWEHQFPIPSYLMVANASIYNRWEEKVARIENPQDSILLSYYVWEEDMGGFRNTDTTYNVKERTFHIIPEMMDSLSNLFGNYPFKKFGTVAVPNYPYGGMEHQSIQTIRRSWLNGSAVGISHELAHMWLGDLITCSHWNDIWLNEGGAVFGSMMYFEKVFMDPWKQNIKVDSRNRYLGNGDGLNRAPLYTDDYGFVFEGRRIPVIYHKAGLVYLMLRNHIGEEKFFEALGKHIEDYRFQDASTEDFKASLKKYTDFDVDNFFDQWVYSSGHPVYNSKISTGPFGEKYRAVIDLEQIQSNLTPRDDCPELFELPLQFILSGAGNIDTIEVLNNQLSQRFEIFQDYKIDSIEFDFNYSLFEINEEQFTSVNESPDVSSKISVYPNLIDQGDAINVNSNEPFKEVHLFDIQGNLVSSFLNLNANMLRIDINQPSGKYFAKVIFQEYIENFSLIVR